MNIENIIYDVLHKKKKRFTLMKNMRYFTTFFFSQTFHNQIYP